LTNEFFHELDTRYGPDGWGFNEQVYHLGKLMLHLMRQPEQ
jgi:hypothetical protein